MYQQNKHTLSCIAENNRYCTLEEELGELFARSDKTIVHKELLLVLEKYGVPRNVSVEYLRGLIRDDMLCCEDENCTLVSIYKDCEGRKVIQHVFEYVQEYKQKLQDILHVQYSIEVSLIESVVKNATEDDIIRLQQLMALLKESLPSSTETTLVLREFYKELFEIADNTMLTAMASQLLTFFEEGRGRYIAEATNRKTLYGHMMRVVRFLSEYDDIGACASVRGQLARIQTYYSVYCT